MLDNFGRLCENVFSCERCKTEFSSGDICIPLGVRKAYFRRTFEKMDAYISPSQYLAQTYIRAGFDYHKMNVLWNGIRVESFADLKKVPSEKIRITTVAVFGRHKGIETLIRTLGLLGRSDVELNLVGDGEERDNYRSIAEECGVLGQIRFWGRIPNTEISRAYAETDIYCLPSIWPENQPVSITEAMVCALPVVASDLGGTRELIVDGETGFIFEHGNEADLAAKLQLLIDSQQLREQFGAAGKSRMLQNSFSRQVEKLVNLYDGIVAAKSVRSKKIIAVMGKKVPRHLDRVTHHDVLLFDWILSENDLKDVIACVIPPETAPNREELRFLAERGIPVIVDGGNYKQYSDSGIRVIPYMKPVEILQIAASM